jgi:hypothetical protein
MIKEICGDDQGNLRICGDDRNRIKLVLKHGFDTPVATFRSRLRIKWKKGTWTHELDCDYESGKL